MSKTILITGAASGIGLYIAQQLAAAGHHIIVTDLNAAHAKEAVGLCPAACYFDAVPNTSDLGLETIA